MPFSIDKSKICCYNKNKQLNNRSIVVVKRTGKRADAMKNAKEVLPICESHEIHDNIISARKETMPNEETLYDLADFFKIFGDSTRMSILFAIDGSPMCVCDIADLLGMTKSAVSHQLKILRQSDLVKYKKSGKNVIYSLADEHVRDIIEKALEHVKE